MANALRSKGKDTVVWILVGLLILGLGGFGVTNFSGSLRSIGSVGKTEVSVNDFARAVTDEIRALSAQYGQQIDMQLAQAIGVDRVVQAKLFADAALDEQAARIGLSVGDAEVLRQIVSAGAFRGLDGGFDRTIYGLTLRQQGLSESEFEENLRADVSRMILQSAVSGGVKAPAAIVDAYTAYIAEARSMSYVELIGADLNESFDEPSEAELRSHHTAFASEFTRPETRQISYVWLTPEMMLSEVVLDEAALRAAYQARITEYVTPERRLVEELIFPSEEEALRAKARVDAGDASFADLAAERGLSLADIDLGDVAISDLGAAGAAVFALPEPGIVGPIPTDFGPALYAVNAILMAFEISFEEAREDLAYEASLDRARRMILERAEEFEDLLAGGATLEQMAEETLMELGSIEIDDSSRDGIAAYQRFRTIASAARESDFAELFELEDGGVFSLRLDAVQPPEVIAFEEAIDLVRAHWEAAQLQSRLILRAEEIVASVENGASLSSEGLITTAVGRLPRGGFLEGMPAALAQTAFTMEEGDARAITADGRVIVVVLEAIHKADPNEPDLFFMRRSLESQIEQTMAQDMLELFTRAVQAEAGLRIDSAAIAAVLAQLQ